MRRACRRGTAGHIHRRRRPRPDRARHPLPPPRAARRRRRGTAPKAKTPAPSAGWRPMSTGYAPASKRSPPRSATTTRRSVASPPANPAAARQADHTAHLSTPTHDPISRLTQGQRQGRALPADHGPRMGARRQQQQLSRPSRRAATLARALQHPQTPQRDRQRDTDRPRSQRPGAGQLAAQAYRAARFLLDRGVANVAVRLEHEHLDGHVRIDVVVAHEGDHLAIQARPRPSG
jgi:hypothetical protein